MQLDAQAQAASLSEAAAAFFQNPLNCAQPSSAIGTAVPPPGKISRDLACGDPREETCNRVRSESYQPNILPNLLDTLL
eukprot:3628166-Pyramimonas_sp.AAC.2